MSNEEAEYTFRPYVNDDIPFIQNSWGTSYYKGASYHHYINPKEFHAFHRPIREAFFLRPTTAVVLCVSKEDQGLIMGWIAVEKPTSGPGIVIHYLYVKQAFKNLGIASSLLNSVTIETPVIYTHITERAQRMMRNSKKRFNDYFQAPHLC